MLLLQQLSSWDYNGCKTSTLELTAGWHVATTGPQEVVRVVSTDEPAGLEPLTKPQRKKIRKEGRYWATFYIIESTCQVKEEGNDVEKAYIDVLEIYADVMPAKLLPVDALYRCVHRVEHGIKLMSDTKPYTQPIYHLSKLELTELQGQLQ